MLINSEMFVLLGTFVLKIAGCCCTTKEPPHFPPVCGAGATGKADSGATQFHFSDGAYFHRSAVLLVLGTLAPWEENSSKEEDSMEKTPHNTLCLHRV